MNEEKVSNILESSIIPKLKDLIAELSMLYNEDTVFPNSAELFEIMTTEDLEKSPVWTKYKDQRWAIGVCGMTGTNLIDTTNGLANSLIGVLGMIEKCVNKENVRSAFCGFVQCRGGDYQP